MRAEVIPSNISTNVVKGNKKKTLKKIMKCWQLYVLIFLPLVYLIVFCYYPMYGAQIAFKRFIPTLGIAGSPWVGFDNFTKFFNSYEFWRIMKNTIGVSVYGLIASFPFPILLAVCLNYAKNKIYMKSVQMITYMPYFISTVVMVGMLMQFMSTTGVVNNFLKSLGMQPIDFLARPEMYQSIYVWSGVWQGVGYSSIIYLAALSGVDQSLHEATIVDGANKFQRVWYIDLPFIMPTAIILLILSMGSILNTGFEKALLLQNPLNLRTSEVIDTYTYKIGLASDSMDYSYSTAIGLFKSVIGLVMLWGVNKLSRKFSDASLW